MKEHRRRERERRGLSGKTGKQPDGKFVNKPYGAADDEVFVKSDSDRGWQRESHAKAVANCDQIILCSLCRDRPAKTLDHSYPWNADGNRCEECGR